MSLVVNTNLGSLSAQRSLATSSVDLKQAMERLSTGKKINTAADDAAGFAIAERMTAQIRGLNHGNEKRERWPGNARSHRKRYKRCH